MAMLGECGHPGCTLRTFGRLCVDHERAHDRRALPVRANLCHGMGVSPLSILHVDDDRFARALIEASLDDAGFHVEAVGSAHAALALAAEQPFDLYLIDLGLPEIGGVELADLLVRDVHDAPVVFVTGSPADAPPDAVVVAKPFSPRQLVDVVVDALAAPAARYA